MRRLLAGLAALLVAVGPVMGRSDVEPPREALAFRPVPDGAAPAWVRSVDSDVVEPVDGVAVQPSMPPRRNPPARPTVRVPEPHLVVVVPAASVPSTSGRLVRGVASWYCGHGSRCTVGHSGGLYAAAGPALRRLLGESYRGRKVLVRSLHASVWVTLIDCNCGPDANLIDLYSDAFLRLAPLSRGVVAVTVDW